MGAPPDEANTQRIMSRRRRATASIDYGYDYSTCNNDSNAKASASDSASAKNHRRRRQQQQPSRSNIRSNINTTNNNNYDCDGDYDYNYNYNHNCNHNYNNHRSSKIRRQCPPSEEEEEEDKEREKEKYYRYHHKQQHSNKPHQHQSLSVHLTTNLRATPTAGVNNQRQDQQANFDSTSNENYSGNADYVDHDVLEECEDDDCDHRSSSSVSTSPSSSVQSATPAEREENRKVAPLYSRLLPTENESSVMNNENIEKQHQKSKYRKENNIIRSVNVNKSNCSSCIRIKKNININNDDNSNNYNREYGGRRHCRYGHVIDNNYDLDDDYDNIDVDDDDEIENINEIDDDDDDCWTVDENVKDKLINDDITISDPTAASPAENIADQDRDGTATKTNTTIPPSSSIWSLWRRRTTKSSVLKRKLWSFQKKALVVRSPLFLFLVVGVSLFGVGLYTRSYATLSIVLNQVTVSMQDRRQKVGAHFDKIERDIHKLERQMLELDPGALFISSSSSSSTGTGTGTGTTTSSGINNNANADTDTDKDTGITINKRNNNGGKYENSILSSSSSSSSSSKVSKNNDPKELRANFGDEEEDESNHNNEVFDELVQMQERLRMSNSEMSTLQKYVQMTSLRDASRKYGTGIIRVKLELEFPEDRKARKNKIRNKNSGATTATTTTTMNHDSSSNNNSVDGRGANRLLRSSDDGQRHSNNEDEDDEQKSESNKNNVLILEMAPLELMPHSVFTFLEMVNSKLFDGCSFILYAMNVIKAAPLPYNGGSASQKVKAFAALGLDTVSFREYTSKYPHDEYTVGFAADGSPSFYINTNDNTNSHVGEPCFAKVVAGFDTVERMKSEPTRNGIWYRKRIGLKRAFIL